LPTKETAPLEPISAYAASKQLGENWIQYYHRAFGLHYTIFRYGNVFGVRQDPHGEAGVVAIFAQQLSQHQPTTIFGQGDKTRDYIYIPDVVAANILALQSGNDQIYNLGLGKPISDQVVYTTIAQHFPQSGKPHFKNIRAGEVMHTYINATKARRDLGWKPHWSFATGVADYVETI
jgi:UDP-glucose 4-epimerase